MNFIFKRDHTHHLTEEQKEQKVLKISAPRVNFMFSKQTPKISIKKVTKKSEIFLSRLK